MRCENHKTLLTSSLSLSSADWSPAGGGPVGRLLPLPPGPGPRGAGHGEGLHRPRGHAGLPAGDPDVD